jgi:hypothetical protein
MIRRRPSAKSPHEIVSERAKNGRALGAGETSTCAGAAAMYLAGMYCKERAVEGA